MSGSNGVRKVWRVTASGFATLLLGSSLVIAKSYDLAIETVDMHEQPAVTIETDTASWCLLDVGIVEKRTAPSFDDDICADFVVAVSGRIETF